MTASTRAEVTVIVPLWQGGEFVAGALDSLAAQTLPPAAVLVVDDGSTDDGPAIAAAHPVVTEVIRQDNAGVAIARNTGVHRATSRFVGFLDQDDLWHPRHLELVSADLTDASAVLTDCLPWATEEDRAALAALGPDASDWPEVWVPAASARDELSRRDPSPRRRQGGEPLAPLDFLRQPQIMTTSFVVEREVAIRAGLFPPHGRAVDDHLFISNVARLAPVVLSEQRTVFYRVRPGSQFHSSRPTASFLVHLAAQRLGGGLLDGAGIEEIAAMPQQPLTSHAVGKLLAMDSDVSLRKRIALSMLVLADADWRFLLRALMRPRVRRLWSRH